MTSSSPTNGSISRGMLELARPSLEILAEEFDANRGVRVVAVADVLAENHDQHEAYDVRAIVADLLGDEVADADDDKGMYGIPAIEAFMTLREAYGDGWATYAYADYLRYYSETPCRDPEDVAAAVVGHAMDELLAEKVLRA